MDQACNSKAGARIEPTPCGNAAAGDPVPVPVLMASSVRAAMIAHAEQTFPEECCGLLIGTQRSGRLVIERTEACRNLLSGQTAALQGFEIDPQDLFSIYRALRDRVGDRVVAHYHSHPNGQPSPSAADIARINDPNMLWAILAMELKQGKGSRCTALTLWQPSLGQDGFEPIPYQVDPLG